ncbi:hypothetical protein HID58_068862, partial [Brassica napus]
KLQKSLNENGNSYFHRYSSCYPLASSWRLSQIWLRVLDMFGIDAAWVSSWDPLRPLCPHQMIMNLHLSSLHVSSSPSTMLHTYMSMETRLKKNNRFVVFSNLSVPDSSFLSSEFYCCCVLHCYYTISLNPSFA